MNILAIHPIVQMLLPELCLLIGGSVILLVGLSKSLRQHCLPIALLVMIAAFYSATQLQHLELVQFSVVELNNSDLVWYVRWVTLAVGSLILLLSRHVPEDSERGEFTGLILFSLCGVMLVPLANNLILLFLALELVSVPTYILVGLSRRNIRAQEAAGKYFFLGAFAAAMTLYGFSFLYGAAGTMRMFGNTPSIMLTLSTPGGMHDPLAQLGIMLALAGLTFKIAAFPFHFYVADVYQGAASPITGMLGFVPKIAGFVAMIQLFSLMSWQISDKLFWMLWVAAAATMVVGNTLALMQNNVKRMLAYSGVAHSGYMLVALVAGPGTANARTEGPLRDGLTALLFYMAIYGVMNLGAFAALSFFRKSGEEEEDSAETLDDLAGAARRHPWACLALSICVLGLMGFPVTGGFAAKLYVFSSALSAYSDTPLHNAMIALVIIGMLNSAIGAAYYLRIVASCYLRKPAEGIAPLPCRAASLSLAICTLIVIAVFVRPQVLFEQSQEATVSIPRADQRFTDAAASPMNVSAEKIVHSATDAVPQK